MTILIVYEHLNITERAHPMHGTPINLLTTPHPPPRLAIYINGVPCIQII
jgi:hypothetical protein